MKTRLIALVPLAVLASADEPAEKRWRAGFDAGVAAAEDYDYEKADAYSEFRSAPKLDAADPVRLERTAAGGGEALVCRDDRISQALTQYCSGHRRSAGEGGLFQRWPAVLLAFVGVAMLAFVSYYWGVDLAVLSLAAITPVALEEGLGKAVANILVPEKDRCSDPQRERLLDDIGGSSPPLRGAGGDSRRRDADGPAPPALGRGAGRP
jgi:hypothetical protein